MALDQRTILIPGGGGPAAVGAIKSLRMSGYKGKIISTDANKLSAGLYLADKAYVVPAASDPSFFQEAMKIIEKEGVDVILPTSGFDIVPYAKNTKALMEDGIIPVVCDYDALERCLDKEKFYYALRDKFDLPYTTREPSDIDAFPCIVKPIRGKGSQNVFICNNRNELDSILSKYEDMLIQEYLPGKEYTIDVLSDLDGHPMVAVPRERVDVKAGISFKGKIVLDESIQNICLRVAESLEIKGPSCMQMKHAADNRPKITEVNPRMGGGTILATYAGINFPKIIMKLLNGDKFEIPEIKEVTMMRYYEEVILDREGNVIRK